jgi:hypothetical protein
MKDIQAEEVLEENIHYRRMCYKKKEWILKEAIKAGRSKTLKQANKVQRNMITWNWNTS